MMVLYKNVLTCIWAYYREITYINRVNIFKHHTYHHALNYKYNHSKTSITTIEVRPSNYSDEHTLNVCLYTHNYKHMILLIQIQPFKYFFQINIASILFKLLLLHIRDVWQSPPWESIVFWVSRSSSNHHQKNVKSRRTSASVIFFLPEVYI